MQPDPQRSRAILVGVTRHRSTALPALPGVEPAVAALARALTAPPTAVLDPARCTVLLDPTYDQVMGALYQAADTTDTLLVHFAGHTVLDDAGRPALACADSEPDLPRSLIGYDRLTDLIGRIRARRRALIVDSGSGARHGWAPEPFLTRLVFAGDGPGAGTAALADLVEYGVADRSPWITPDVAYPDLRRHSLLRGRPFDVSVFVAGEPVVIARNARRRLPPPRDEVGHGGVTVGPALPQQRIPLRGRGDTVGGYNGRGWDADTGEFARLGDPWDAPGSAAPDDERAGRAARPSPEDRLARHVNVDVLDAVSGAPVPGPLAVDTRYLLEVDIGPLRRTGVRALGDEALPVDRLPPSDVGWWLELSLSSRDVRCPPRPTPVFLGVVGAAYRCGCAPYTRHSCDETARTPRVELPFVTAGAGEAELRLVVYHGPAAVQVLRIVVVVRAEGQHRREVVFSLTRDLRGLGRFADRSVGIVAAEPVAGRHQLVLNDGEHAPEPFELAEEQAGTAARLLRTRLFTAHLVQHGDGSWGSRYDAAFAKPPALLAADLHGLAVAGREAYVAMFPDAARRRSLRDRLALGRGDGLPGTIQVARTANSRVAVPWQLLYELPVPDRLADATICPGLADLERDPFRVRCRLEDDPGHHGPHGVVCPFGFWGVAYRLEVPPWSRGADLAERTGADAPATVLAAVNRAAVGAGWDPHRAALDRICRPPEALVVTSTAALRAAAVAGVDLLYFLCHGRREPHWLGGPDRVELELGPADRITPQGVADWAELSPPVRWATRRPLVVLNGCHTGEVLPATLAEFVSAFVGSLGAAGVLTTEVAIDSGLACHAVELLLSHLWTGDGVGLALWRVRRQLLARGNVMGLAYSAYCDVNLRLPTMERSWDTARSSAASARPASAS
ncbi:hypothetical protein Daura_27915 [Dactylosporangium aurantiacum]|uniref:CHAT domain-containing protein n=1 Tax=Dactylosporangium aurantiacum TaxID=35754 RepID=A0A9Q9IA33_9ACTN|nr:hypothetical protein [Dactylosporangium aurantiacum]MDG6106995.1 hypothetical protein [Dactylosporangium aurantiacum]UWZ50645.1 hypothetical protein Daura_27915 [Dactylosporangium aurantiacum]